MSIPELPDDCREILSRDDRKRFRHPLSGSTVWTFGSLLQVDSTEQVVTGLTATEPGNYAHDLSRFSSIAVAQSEDGDLLMCEPNPDGAVSILRHEDQSLEKLKRTLVEWVADATSCDVDANEPTVADLPASLIGRWHASRSPDLSQDVIDKQPDIEIRADGSWILYWIWPMEEIEHFKCFVPPNAPKRLKVEYGEDLLSYEFEIRDGRELMLRGPDCHQDVFYQRV